jgi:hypothetical protein
MIRVLIIKPNEEPEEAWIENNYKVLQSIVHGLFQFMEFDEKNPEVMCMLNEEHLLHANANDKFRFNRYVKSDYHTVENRMAAPSGVPVFGNFAIIRNDYKTSETISLTDDDVAKYSEVYKLCNEQ